MRTMSWEEIDKDWSGLQKRHKGEVAAAVARYCIGHSIHEVAQRLERDQRWIQDQLTRAGLHASVGGTVITVPESAGRNILKDERRLVSEFAPNSTEEKGEDFQNYIDHYKTQGYTQDVAKRLARAEWAGEAAVEAGVIKESKNRRDEKVNRILFPDDSSNSFELSLRHHMAHVEAAARFLNDAKMPHLRRKSTCEKVSSANAKWLEQVERIRNLHPTFDKVS